MKDVLQMEMESEIKPQFTNRIGKRFLLLAIGLMLCTMQLWALDAGDPFTVTINGQSHPFTADTDGYYTLDRQKLIALSRATDSPSNVTDENENPVATGRTVIWGFNYKLATDITFANEEVNEAGNLLNGSGSAQNDWNGDGNIDSGDDKGFSPIGISNSTYFTGNVNGYGYAIKNLRISAYSNHYCGLFGYIKNSTLTNLVLENVQITSSKNAVGGLAGGSDASTAENCHTTGNVTSTASYVGGLIGFSTSSTTEGCHSTAKVNGSKDYVGGLIGYSNVAPSSVNNCYATGAVEGKKKYTGGLIGFARTVSNCYATGDVTGEDKYTGGLVGSIDTSITNCYATGTVDGNDQYVGGLAGQSNNINCEFNNCYATGNVNGDGDDVGGLVGYAKNAIANCYATGNIDGDGDNVGGLAGWTSGTIDNCYTTGTIEGYQNVGGVAGYSLNYIRNCYATGSVKANSSCVGGIAGRCSIRVSNCYAFNSSLSGTSGVHRISGIGSVSDCHATTVTGFTPTATGSNQLDGETYYGTPLDALAVLYSNNSTKWAYESWATESPAGTGEDYIIWRDSADRYDHPALAFQMRPILNSLSIKSDLACNKGASTKLEALSVIAGNSITYNTFSDSGTKQFTLTIPGDAQGTWYKSDDTFLADETLVADTELYFTSNDNATTGTSNVLTLSSDFVTTGGRIYSSSSSATVSLKIMDLTATLSNATLTAQGGTATITVKNNGIESENWKLAQTSAVDGIEITSGTSPSAIAPGNEASGIISVSKNTTTSAKTYEFTLQDDSENNLQTFILTQQAGETTLSTTLSSTEEIPSSGGQITVTITNSGTANNSWKLLKGNAIDGFSISSSTDYIAIPADTNATATITISQNDSTSAKSCTFHVYGMDNDTTPAYSFTIIQKAAASNSTDTQQTDDSDSSDAQQTDSTESSDDELNISSIGGVDSKSGNTIKVSEYNTSAVTVHSADVTITEDNDAETQDNTGNPAPTSVIVLSDNSVAGSALRNSGTSMQDSEVIIASLQNNGALVSITSQSAPDEDSENQTTARGILCLDPSTIIPADDNALAMTLNDNSTLDITSIPTGIKPDYGMSAEIDLTTSDKVSIETKITKSSIQKNTTATINLNLYVTQTSNSITTTEHVDGPVFVNKPYTFSYPLADLNFDSTEFTLLLMSDNGTASYLHTKGNVPENDSTNGYYELSGDNITITVWHFSSLALSAIDNSSSSDESSGACTLECGNTPATLIPLLAAFALLLLASRKRAER